jgi:hypothetical protein
MAAATPTLQCARTSQQPTLWCVLQERGAPDELAKTIMVEALIHFGQVRVAPQAEQQQAAYLSSCRVY